MAIVTDTDAAKATRGQAAVVVDLGSKSKKSVKQLRKGEGALLDEVNHVINELRTAGAITGPAQPVIVIVRERSDDSGTPTIGIFGM